MAVRRTSPIEETGPIYRKDARTDAVVYRALVEFEALATVAEIPGALDGGFQLDSDTVRPTTGSTPPTRSNRGATPR